MVNPELENAIRKAALLARESQTMMLTILVSDNDPVTIITNFTGEQDLLKNLLLELVEKGSFISLGSFPMEDQ